jgi:hypothetical protein
MAYTAYDFSVSWMSSFFLDINFHACYLEDSYDNRTYNMFYDSL